MYILWAGLTLLYGYSFLDTYFVQGDSGGIVMGLMALLFAALGMRSYRKRWAKKRAKLLGEKQTKG